MRRLSRKFSWALGLALSATSLLPLSSHAEMARIDVIMNQATIVKLTRAADTIVIGNPAIADAAVQDSTTIVLTGKGFGTTNMVVLDVDGEPIVDQQITVSRNDTNSLRIYRRASMQTYSCTPYCEGAYKTGAETESERQLNDN